MKIIRYPNLPRLLQEIVDPPKCLYCYGDTDLLYKRCITVIGTRSITGYGKEVVRMFIDKYLKDLDIVVVSGIARGIDGYVHAVCLERGIHTIAVVPGGIDTAVPQVNRDILREILKKELVVAEYPRGSRMNKYMYIQRNRILAGISKSTVVIEAGQQSGSLTTAKLALEYNRDLYVVPGNITSPVSAGCNILAREGANVLTGLADMKEIVGIYEDQRVMPF